MRSKALCGHARAVIVGLIGSPTRTNVQLAFAWRRLGVDTRVLWPNEALAVLRAGDVAITRLDVRPTLDGVEPGLEVLDDLGREAIRVLNRPDAVLACHDKLETAKRLGEAGISHPWTIHLLPGEPVTEVRFPCVLKPRFGSWGQDVLLCRTVADLARMVELIAERPWWRRQGAIAQELVTDARYDVRIVVAGTRVVAAGQRIAANGEWRTNVTLGGTVVQAELPPGTAELALETTRAIGVDFAGVDLLPTDEGWTVLELNGAVDFDTRYALPGLDPYGAILDGLEIEVEMRKATGRGRLVPTHRTEVAMTKTMKGKPAQPGDHIVITGHAVGNASRTAEILEVLGDPGHERFRVRWEDGHESILFPADDAVVHRPARRRTKSPAA